MDKTNLIGALVEALAATEKADRAIRPMLMADELLESLRFRAWLGERLAATVTDAEFHTYDEQADDLCGGPPAVRIAPRNGGLA